MNKRGELTSGQIVMLILAIAGFAIVMLFVMSFFGNDNLERDQLCELSVVQRATLPDFAADAVPLNCETEKICVSSEGDKDSCKQFSGEGVHTAVEIDNAKVNNEDELDEQAKLIEEQVANEMIDCWRNMGQGKLDIFGDVDYAELSGPKKPKCVVCSRIAFDEVNDKIMSSVDVNEFMDEEKVPGSSLTYYETLNGVGARAPASIDKLEAESLARKELEAENFSLAYGSEDLRLANDQVAIMFTQIRTEASVIENVKDVTIAGVVLYGSVAMSRFGKPLLSIPGAILSGLGITGAAAVSAYNTLEGQEISRLYCGSFTSVLNKDNKDGSRGCSIVRVVDWSPQSVSQINSLCQGGIEGKL